MINIRQERREVSAVSLFRNVPAVSTSSIFVLPFLFQRLLCCRLNLMVYSPFGEHTIVTLVYAQSANP